MVAVGICIKKARQFITNSNIMGEAIVVQAENLQRRLSTFEIHHIQLIYYLPERGEFMNKEIKKRKRSFWAVFVVTLLMAIQIVPIAVSAANHSFDDVTDNPATEPTKVSIIHPGDVLTTNYGAINSVIYYDKDGTTLLKEVELQGRGVTHTVMDYSDMPTPRQISDDGFKEWKVTSVDKTGGVAYIIQLTAVEYPVSSISYQLNGGSNSDANPSEYHEGFGVPNLENANKEGYNFDGWYSDAAFTTKVTSIAPDSVGDVVLYAKFSPKQYNINYSLNGGSNGQGNPQKYTVGTGVTELADAQKAGYTFEGWYTSPDFKENSKITSISSTQTGNVTLYAKFKQDSGDSPEAGDSGDSPEAGDNGKMTLLGILCAIAGCGLIGITITRRRRVKED